MDKLDKEVLYWSVWKLIQFIYGIAVLLAIVVGIITILYFLNGMKDENISQTGMIKVWTIIIVVIVLRNILKPYFKKMTNNYMD
ncbi:hypothetical protein [Aegicerativicinus sediminis]|uniref:hypothetical protein n=1 Tax=Aegicerativicinus sediminis TaxID=2893202 RepID=UPI001E38568A|nr:hypothetical protein [Aegicerativicinus sediminis]